jgi:hypothetical protein
MQSVVDCAPPVDFPAVIDSLPEFELATISHGNGSPDIVTITPIHRGGGNYNQDQVFLQIALTLQSAVIGAITQFNPNFCVNNFGRVNGILQMNNINDYRHAHANNINLNEFGLQDIQEIFERVVGYGEISIFDVSFSFWINPLSLKQGIECILTSRSWQE